MAESAPLFALVVFTLVSLGLGVVAKVAASTRYGFLRKYFLGNRTLGPFAVALTAAVMSGGTFMGFPSMVYTFGWVVGLWIASYMVAGLTVLGLLGRRVGHLARKTGAITLPDLLRERYDSPALGLLTSVLIMGFLTVNLIPQFKAGALIVKTVLPPGFVQMLDTGSTAPAPPADVPDSPSGATDSAPGTAAPERDGGIDRAYYAGLALFSLTVVAYTAYGGFLAAIWTDVFQSLIMAVGVLILLPLALGASGGLVAATVQGVEQAGTGFAFGPGAGRDFHTLPLAISFFFMWAISGAGQPSTMVRLMAFRSTRTLRYAISYLTIYNAIVYIPLIFIFVAARGILPELAAQGRSDEVMPLLVKTLANPYVAGLILAAPYGAVMSTVSGFLLIVASGLVRDIYQRFLRPTASERELAVMSYLATIGVGVVVAVVALRPPEFLQMIVVFAGAGMAASFLAPALLGCYWRRATAPGAIAAMTLGALTTVGLYLVGTFRLDSAPPLSWLLPPNPDVGAPSAFTPYYLLGFHPCLWGFGLSLASGVIVSLLTRPPDSRIVSRLFDAPDAEEVSATPTPS